MKYITQLFRILIGALFIFSAYVKLVDPIGSQYKFQEYFNEGVLNMEFLIPYALPFAILLIIAEIGLGVFLLMGYKPKFTVWSLLFLLLIFLFLTWYSAYYNKVTDCGCFGDAVKLTPWETFYKNVITLPIVLFLVWRVKDIKPVFSEKLTSGLSILSIFGFLFITYYVLTHLPIIDFRPYAVGKSIPEGMEYKNDGNLPPISDFSLETRDQDITEEVLAEEKVMLIVIYDIFKSDERGLQKLKEVANNALKKGYKVYGASASFDVDLQKVIKKYNLPFSFLFSDGTVLKTIIRANPGIVILNKGTVTQKYNWTDINKLKL